MRAAAADAAARSSRGRQPAGELLLARSGTGTGMRNLLWPGSTAGGESRCQGCQRCALQPPRFCAGTKPGWAAALVLLTMQANTQPRGPPRTRLMDLRPSLPKKTAISPCRSLLHGTISDRIRSNAPRKYSPPCNASRRQARGLPLQARGAQVQRGLPHRGGTNNAPAARPSLCRGGALAHGEAWPRRLGVQCLQQVSEFVPADGAAAVCIRRAGMAGWGRQAAHATKWAALADGGWHGRHPVARGPWWQRCMQPACKGALAKLPHCSASQAHPGR